MGRRLFHHTIHWGMSAFYLVHNIHRYYWYCCSRIYILSYHFDPHGTRPTCTDLVYKSVHSHRPRIRANTRMMFYPNQLRKHYVPNILLRMLLSIHNHLVHFHGLLDDSVMIVVHQREHLNLNILNKTD